MQASHQVSAAIDINDLVRIFAVDYIPDGTFENLARMDNHFVDYFSVSPADINSSFNGQIWLLIDENVMFT